MAITLPLVAGCTVGPDYQRPAPGPTGGATPIAFKELAGWKPSDPRDGIDRGAWWSLFNDPVLDGLEKQVVITNQNVKQAEAAYRQALALTAEARANLFPTVAVAPSVTRSKSSSVSGASLGGGPRGAFTDYSAEGTVSWTIDVWGKIRRQIEAQSAAAQASSADLANATLSAQGTLAQDYFSMRGQDSLIKLLTDTVAAYQRALDITNNQYNAGTVSRADVLAADAQLQSAKVQLVAAGVTRATYEHAIAVLAGHAPADVTIAAALLPTQVPVVPTGVPSALLERRPDIAASERAMAEENANIGVAIAAYYPEISLTAAFGFAGDPLSKVFSAADRVWSLGASASETVFQGGARAAAVQAARAVYDESVASYRQTVLTAFQQVEDELSTLRILQQEADAAAASVTANQRATDVALNEYRAGTVAYTTVITEQTALLSAQETALTTQQNRFVAAVTLIEALGGGWTMGDLASGG
jgi:NodT family efflux transporter outer membrane factor (OMF) lipoprotein